MKRILTLLFLIAAAAVLWDKLPAWVEQVSE